MSDWPGGVRHPISQSDHDRWNATHYPGTRQVCVECDAPTARCEEDEIYTEAGHGPLCLGCWHETPESEASESLSARDLAPTRRETADD